MKTLTQIIAADAEFMANVTVHVVSNMGTVCISDDDGLQDDIFLQGDDGSAFISERESLWHELGDIDRGSIELHLAKPYVENLWS